MGSTETRDWLMRAKPAVRETWQARWAVACGQLPQGDRIFLLMLLLAIDAKAGGGIRAPRLGDNAIIKADRTVWSQYADAGNRERGVCRICTVDQLNRHLGWMMEAIGATDTEYRVIVDKVSGWISRDETQMGLHVDRQVAAAEESKDTDLTPVYEELKEKGKL